MKDLAGTGALVVGATGRLGEEIARKLSADRTRLVLAGRDGSRLEAVMAGLGGPTWIAAGDLTDPAAIDRLAADATADAVLQAIRRDRPQVVVASRLVRAQLAARSLLPGLAEQVTTTVGVTAYFRRVAAGEPGRES